MILDTLVAMTPEVAAGIIGAISLLLSGAVAGWVSFFVGERAQRAAAQAWMRESRRGIYDDFLDSAQQLLIACDERSPDKDAISEAHSDFFAAYGRVQLVAQPSVVEAVRAHAYRLWELEEERLSKQPVLRPDNANDVSRSVRDARHETVDAMRKDLDPEGEPKSARPAEVYNPFEPPGHLDTAPEYIRRLKKAYEDELTAAGEDKHKVRPGWDGSPYGSAHPDSEQSNGTPTAADA